jgi:GntR family transcriptional regulator, rspAB operon transcriptional repressor
VRETLTSETPRFESVYARLREAILNGELAPGVALSGEITRLGLEPHRACVSEAIGRLGYDGLVDFEPEKGAAVSLISLADVREGLFIRMALENEVAAEAASRMPESGKYELRQNLRRQRTAMKNEDNSAFFAADVEFHEIFTRSLRLNATGHILSGLRVHLDRIRRCFARPDDLLSATLKEHEAIANAVASGDTGRARNAMAAHLRSTVERVEREVRERPWVFCARRANGAPE